jgi:STE24 endopeptidase
MYLNLYGWIILGALLAEHVLGGVANLLELRSLRRPPPPEVAGVFDEARWEELRRYARVRTRFGLVRGTFDITVLLTFWGVGGFAWLDRWTRGLGLPWLATGVLFIGVLAVASLLLSTPFEAWSTFVIEERFGFNRTGLGTFVLDRLKGLLLALLLGLPLLALVLLLFRRAGDVGWLWAWGATAVFTVALQVLVPRVILPLFNRFEPLGEGSLRDRLEGYLKRVGFPFRDLSVMDGSRRSTRGNAFFAGFGRARRIALFDTLVERHTVPELVAVVAHEVGHFRLRHVYRQLVLGIAELGVVFFLLGYFLGQPGLYAAFRLEEPSLWAGLVFFGLLVSPLSLVLSVAGNALSRRFEYQADGFAAATVEEPGAMISALRKLAADNLANPAPHPLRVVLSHSHPPLRDRIAALRDRGVEEPPPAAAA